MAVLIRRGSVEPVLYRETRDLPEMSDVRCHHREIVSESDGRYAQVGVADQGSPSLQLSPHLAVATGSRGVERKDGQVGQQRLVQTLQQDAGALLQPVLVSSSPTPSSQFDNITYLHQSSNTPFDRRHRN